MRTHMPIYMLRRAIVEIAFDAGAVYRAGPTAEQIAERVLMELQTRHTFSVHQLRAVGEELDCMTLEDLLVLCTGEQGVVQASKLTALVLNTAFDMV